MYTNIIKRPDNSYVIDGKHGPYHVPQRSGFADLWADVNAYALAHPDEVTVELPPAPPTLEQTRLAKLAEINAGYESVMEYVQSGYPDKEVLSWERQATQARELKANPDAEASFVRTLAAVKDVPVQEMADRIINNAENWEPVAAMLTAQRQLLEEAAYLAVTVEEVQAIKVSYTV